MQWLNEPPQWRQEGNRLEIRSDSHSDFWRRTHYGFIRDSGHCYGELMAGDCTAEVRVMGGYRDLYDQAGLMLRLDEQTWLKCGIEYVEGVQHLSAVVTREYSDWSVWALPENPPAVWLRVRRQTEAVEVHFSLDGERYQLHRLAYLPPGPALVGPMCASPEGEGFVTVFEGFSITPG